jgi:hypothetical protein
MLTDAICSSWDPSRKPAPAVPLAGAMSAHSSRSVVVLPAPLGPRKPKTLLADLDVEILTAVRRSNRFVRRSVRRTTAIE